MTELDIKLCHSVKSKYAINMQCCNKQKSNESLCGKHLNSKTLILYKNNLDIMINPDMIYKNPDMIHKIPVIYTIDQLFEKILSNAYIDVTSLRKSIKTCSLKFLINTKESKSHIINQLKVLIAKERYYESNETSIILIQSYFRRWLVHRKTKCINDTDILTFTCKYEITDMYFYTFIDKISNKRYGYDIRTLLEILKSEYPSCPYTFRPFTDDERNSIYMYRNKLLNKGINISLNNEPESQTYEEYTDLRIKDVFYQINMLDNYTDHRWFKNLSLTQLVVLYSRAEDIWNYRTAMDIEARQKIVHNGNAFNIPLHLIKAEKSKIRLQNIILDDFYRMTKEGINRDEKKVGAILVLTALVEVSVEAADALPHLVQV